MASDTALLPVRVARRRLYLITGGPVRAQALLLIGCVLALDTADLSMLGAIATNLEPALRLSNTDFGLLASVPSLAAALATLPIGILTDRVCRTRLLAVTIVLWGAAMVVSAISQSFLMLLLTRLALGAAQATAGPTVSSLIGDYFPVSERGRIWGIVLGGELLGAAFGFVGAGLIAGIVSWRASFVALAVPSLALAWALARWLPEPARGGASRLEPGATEFVSREAVAQRQQEGLALAEEEAQEIELSAAQEEVEQEGIKAHEDLVLDAEPTRMPLWDAVRYVLRIRTNVVLIVASALGYFYFTGIQTFGLVYIQHHYGLSQGIATLLLGAVGVGALIGVVGGGRLGDRMLERGNVNGRITVGAYSFMISTALFVPFLLGRQLSWTLPLLVAAGVAFAAREPVLDAARLDIMHHRLWGRAEGVRTFLRRLMVAAAPISFGAIADALQSGTPASGQHGFGAGASAGGLNLAFLVLAATLALGGLLTLRARRTYPRDVATAVASEEATARH